MVLAVGPVKLVNIGGALVFDITNSPNSGHREYCATAVHAQPIEYVLERTTVVLTPPIGGYDPAAWQFGERIIA